MVRKTIIDTDPGIDDAVALFLALASPELDVIGLTTVFGNAHTSTTTRNALALLEIAGRTDIPVSRGADRPLASDYPGPVPHIHGDDGQGNADLDEPDSDTTGEAAADWIFETVSSAPNEITLLTLGPLTNLAHAVRKYPDLPSLVDELVIMGGNALVPGNATPAAEANMMNDPEAADVVFGQPWKTTMVGLDVTHQVNLTSRHIETIISGDDAASRHLAIAVPFYQSFFEKTNGTDGIYSHDPTAVAYLIRPDLFDVQRWPIRVESEGISRGKTWPSLGDTDDAAPAAWRDRPGISVATGVDGESVAALVVDRLSSP